MNGLQFAILAAIGLTVAFACAPVKEVPAEEDNTDTSGGESESGSEKRKRRSAEEVIVTIVTNLPFEPSRINVDKQIVKNVIDDFQRSQGLHIDFANIDNAAENLNGKFAVTYLANDDCERVTKFVVAAKSATGKVESAIINCPGSPTVTL